MRVTDKVAKEAAKFHVALERAPEFAAQVGVLMSCFALVEEYVPHLVVKLTGMPHADAWIIVNSYQSFSYRIELLKELIKNRDHAQDVTAYKHFVATLSAANALRNQYAHARYSLAERDDATRMRIVVVREFPTAIKKKPREHRMTPKKIDADVAQMKLIICDLHAFVERGEMPLQ